MQRVRCMLDRVVDLEPFMVASEGQQRHIPLWDWRDRISSRAVAHTVICSATHLDSVDQQVTRQPRRPSRPHLDISSSWGKVSTHSLARRTRLEWARVGTLCNRPCSLGKALLIQNTGTGYRTLRPTRVNCCRWVFRVLARPPRV